MKPKSTEDKTGEVEITPLVETISGVIEVKNNFDHKREYIKYLIKKYK